MSKLTNQEVAEEIANKGLWYCLMGRIDAHNIEDPKLAAVWEKAEKALDDIRDEIIGIVGEPRCP